MSDDELRAALRAKMPEQRFAAAYVVGEKRLNWQEDLIGILGDPCEAVRQAARRGLVILSFLALNPEEAARFGSPAVGRPATPLARLNRPVDFGPLPGASKTSRDLSAKRWAEWWEKQKREPSLSTDSGAAWDRAKEVERMAAALVEARPERRQQLLKRYGDERGVRYTEALACAIARLSGEPRQEARQLLAQRLTRMTEKTLGRYLQDPDAEIRRAAVLALGMRRSTAHVPRMINLLLDADPTVRRATHAALTDLSSEDFGPRLDATEEEGNKAVARWRQWWLKSGTR